MKVLKRFWHWWVGKPIDWSHRPTKEYTDWLENNGPR